MKANRKFLNNDDEAVSPVIAVILRVAITVVLAATVYVWVSGFGSNSSQPAKSLAITSAGALKNDCDGDATTGDYCKQYTVASGSPGLRYTDLSLTLNGAAVTCPTTEADGATADEYSVSKDGGSTWADCTDSNTLVSAGDLIQLGHDANPAGNTFRFLDSASNSIILTPPDIYAYLSPGAPPRWAPPPSFSSLFFGPAEARMISRSARRSDPVRPTDPPRDDY